MTRAPWLLLQLFSSTSVQVTRFSFQNRCLRDIYLSDWDLLIEKQSSKEIKGLRSSNLQRISWRFKDGPWDTDFIELNGDWHGIGTRLGHPNYATWAGFSMSSRYEALDPLSGDLACSDAAAELTWVLCPSRSTPRGALGAEDDRRIDVYKRFQDMFKTSRPQTTLLAAIRCYPP